MGAHLSNMKDKITGSSTIKSPTLTCTNCGHGSWRFIGTEGRDFIHYCTSCKQQSKLDNVYGIGDYRK